MEKLAVTFLQKYFKFDVRFVVRSSFWLLLGHLIGILSALATSYVFANYLSPDIYGQYKYIISVGILLSAFSLTGTTTSIIQASAKNLQGFYSYIKIKNLQHSLPISLLALIGTVYYFINDNSTLATGLFIIAITQPFFNNSTLFYSQLQGKERYDLTTIGHTIKATFTTIVIVSTVLLTDSITILLVVYFASYIFINYLLQYVMFKDKETSGDEKEFQSLFRYTKHTSVQNIVSGISNQLDKILVFQNLGAVELAVYTFATVLPDQYKGITKTVDIMLLPRFSKHKPESIRSNIVYKSFIYFTFLSFATAVYILLAPYIYNALFPQYSDSIFLSQIYVVSMVFGIAGIPLAALKAEMSNRNLYKLNSVTSFIQIVSLFILIYLWGLFGAIVARLISRAFTCFYVYYLYLRKM